MKKVGASHTDILSNEILHSLTLCSLHATEQKIRIVGVIYIYSTQKKIWTQLNDAFKSLYDTNFQV